MNWYEMNLGDENCLPSHFFADDEELFGLRLFDLKQGIVVRDWNSDSLIRSSRAEFDGEPDDILANSLVVPVFSRRLRESLAALDIAVGDIQYLPIRVRRSTGEELPGFAVVNVISRLPALDRERSKMLEVHEDEIDTLTGLPKVVSLWTAALKAASIQGHDVIRLLEFFPSLFVSERFVEVCRNGTFTGASFSPVPVSWCASPSTFDNRKEGERNSEG